MKPKIHVRVETRENPIPDFAKPKVPETRKKCTRPGTNHYVCNKQVNPQKITDTDADTDTDT